MIALRDATLTATSSAPPPALSSTATGSQPTPSTSMAVTSVAPPDGVGLSSTDVSIMFIVVALYGALFLLSLGRFIHRFVLVDGCSPSRWRRRTLAGILLILTGIYSASRCALVAMSALRVLNATQDGLIAHFETTIPAALFLLLQTVMLLKWERHVRTLTMQLHHLRFQLGAILIWTSVVLSIIMMAATAIAIADHATHFTRMSDVTWNHILTCLCGLAFTFNGGAFITLGILLKKLWRPVRLESQRAARRALFIAAVFGTLCVVRGLLLISFFLDQTEQLGAAYHSPLGPSLVLLMESVCLIVVGVLYAAPGADGSGADGSDGGGMSTVDEEHEHLGTPAAVEGRRGFDSGALHNVNVAPTTGQVADDAVPFRYGAADTFHAPPASTVAVAPGSLRQPPPDDWTITNASYRAVGSALDARSRQRSF